MYQKNYSPPTCVENSAGCELFRNPAPKEYTFQSALRADLASADEFLLLKT